MGTDHGLDHFREPSFLPALPKPGVADFGIQAQKDGHVWIGSAEEEDYGSPLRRERPRRLRFLELTFRASTKPAVGPCGLRLTRPWGSDPLASTRDRPKDGKTTSLPLTPELRSQVAVQSIVEDRGGAVWASFIPYGLAKWEGGHWIRNGGLTGLPEAWVVILNTGPDGKFGLVT